MPSEIKTRFGSTRGSPEAYFRVLVSRDGGQSYTPALVMKKDDRDVPDRKKPPFRVKWAATKELEREAEATLSGLDLRFSAKHTRTELERFLRVAPRRYVPPDAEIPVGLDVQIANSPIVRGMHAGEDPAPWEQELDAAARRRAGIIDGASNEEDVPPSELFQWIPWFEELAVKVGEVRREGLVERAREVDWAGVRCAVLAQGAEEADPLTFFYHLSSIARGADGADTRKTVYASVAKEFGIDSDLDYGLSDRFIFPHANPQNVEFHSTGDDPNVFWDMFDQARACGPGGESYEPTIAEAFVRSLQVKGVGVAKLTHVLFLINPRAFVPLDRNAVSPLGVGSFKRPPDKKLYAEYVDEMQRIRTAFPGCQPYEINVISYLWTSGKLPRKGLRWYQIGVSDDEWRDFRDNHRVHHVGKGMDEPNPGDVILVRSGTREGRGIGIVYGNDSGQQPRPSDQIHMLWINKKHAPLAADMPTTRFSRVGRAAYEAFAKSDAYRETLSMLQPPVPPPTPVHDLNTILYGPPGTGKTWHTVTRSVAIVENREVSEVA